MSNIVSFSWERGPDASRMYCKTGNVSVRPPPHLSFSTGMDFSSVEVRPLWRFSDVLTSMGEHEACLQYGSGRAQRTLERTLGGRSARDPAPGVFFCGNLQAAGWGMQTEFSAQRPERLFVQLTDVIVPFGYAQHVRPSKMPFSNSALILSQRW